MEPEVKVISHNLTHGPIGKTLLRLTSPMVWGLMAIISLNLIDTYFIAKLGKDELAAMSFALPVVLILMSISLGLSVGTGSLVSRALGRDDHAAAKLLTTSSLVFTFGFMVLMALFGIATIESLFSLFNAPETVMPYIKDYMRIWYLGLPAMGLAMVGNSAITATGDVRLPATIMILVALLNLILDPLLIFGLLGFPRLEMQGAALATVISYLTAFCICFWGISIKKRMLLSRIRFKQMFAPWKALFHISAPAAASQMIVPLTAGLTVWMLSGFGAGVVGGYGIVSRLEAFSLIVIIGLSNCISPFVGQNWGAKQFDRAHQALVFGYQFSLAWGLIVAVLLAAGNRFIPELFIEDSIVISTVSQYLLIVPLSYGAVGCLFVTNAFLNAIGMSYSVAMITVIRYFVLYVPLALIAMTYFGPKGIFAIIALTNVIMGVTVYFWARNKLKSWIGRTLAGNGH